jgi:hypothetical protein
VCGREPEDEDPDHYALYAVGATGDEHMLRLVRLSVSVRFQKGTAAQVGATQDRPLADVVRAWGEDRAVNRLFFKRRDAAMVLKINPDLLEVCTSSAVRGVPSASQTCLTALGRAIANDGQCAAHGCPVPYVRRVRRAGA